MKYENYIFDLYGTLVDIHTDEEDDKLWEALADFYDAHGATYTATEIQADYLADVAARLEVTEEIQVEDVFRQLFAAKGVIADDALVLKTCRFFRDTSPADQLFHRHLILRKFTDCHNWSVYRNWF